MPNTLKIKRGTAATIPQGQLAEPLFTTDTYDLYIGKGSGGNQRFQKYIASGTSSQFLKGDGSLDSNTYEPSITAGTTLQYWRGDKSWQTLNTAAVPESGAIYFTEPRVLATVLTGLNLSGGGTIAATDSVLTAFGKIQNQISGIAGGVSYQGTWNANTNSPTLTSSVGTKGYYYVVSVNGSTNLNGITDWKVGDWAIFNGTTWDKVDNTDAVSSVNGFTGAVNLGLGNISDVTLSSPTNAQLLRFNGTSSKWENWTPTYISAAITSLNGLTAATQTFATGTSGTDFTISSSTSTHTFNIPSASATSRGLLDTSDYNTFAGKQSQLNGTGFVKATGTTINYDNSTYLTTSSAASTYLPLAGGTLTGTLNGTSANFSSTANFGSSGANGDVIITSNGNPLLIQGRGIYNRGFLALSWQITPDSGIIIGSTLGFNVNATPGSTIGSRALTLATTGAATFASSIEATSSLFTGNMQIGNNQNLSLKFRTATAWDYSIRGVNDDLFISDNPGLNYISLFYSGGGNNRYISLMNSLNITALGAATFSSTVAGYGLSVTNVEDSSQGLLVRSTDADTTLYLARFQSSATAVSTTWVDRFSIAKNGSTVVGDNTPINNVRLYVKGASTTSSNYALNIADSNGADIAWFRDDKVSRFFGNVGIGVTPAANLQVAAASSPVIALNATSSLTTGSRGDYAWYNSSVSTVALIRATAVTDNVGTQLEFYTRPAAGSLTQVLTISSTGLLSGSTATFSGSVTANNNITLSTDGTYGSNYITLGFGGSSNGSNRIFAGTSSSVDGIFIAAATGRAIYFRPNGGTADRLSILDSYSITTHPILANSPAEGNTGESLIAGRSFKIDATGTGQRAVSYMVSNTLSDTYGSGLQAQYSNFAGDKAFGFNLNTSGSFETFIKDSGGSFQRRLRINQGGQFLVNVGSSAGFGDGHRIYRNVGEGDYIMSIDGGTEYAMLGLCVTQGNYSAAKAGQWVGRNSSTTRSINAGGTINASGADYAEYMTKAISENINKGDIVGINSNGLLTNIFDDSVSFVVKSTDPSYVGGDTWGNVDIVGKPPSNDATQQEKDDYEKRLEEQRKKVDRIAFSGQIPCNVYNTKVGDYIIPIKLENGKIAGKAVSNPTLDEYKISVGKVWKIMDDGRSWIAVKIG